MAQENEIGYVSFHINNGGIHIGVEDRDDGAMLVIGASHFGVMTNRMELPTNPNELRELARFFERMSKKPMHAHHGYTSDILKMRVKDQISDNLKGLEDSDCDLKTSK